MSLNKKQLEQLIDLAWQAYDSEVFYTTISKQSIAYTKYFEAYKNYTNSQLANEKAAANYQQVKNKVNKDTDKILTPTELETIFKEIATNHFQTVFTIQEHEPQFFSTNKISSTSNELRLKQTTKLLEPVTVSFFIRLMSSHFTKIISALIFIAGVATLTTGLLGIIGMITLLHISAIALIKLSCAGLVAGSGLLICSFFADEQINDDAETTKQPDNNMLGLNFF